MKALVFVAVVALAALGAVPWQSPAGVGGPPQRCPKLGWLRIQGLHVPMVAVDLLWNPPLPGIPPSQTLADLTAHKRATLLLILASLSDRAQIVDDIEAQLKLLGLGLAR